MATENQFAANCANAQKSTGPKTEAGKAASSQNAAKHNLTSKYLIILPGQEDAFAELESGLRAKLKPAGALEDVIYKRIVECAWNLERCRKAELDVLKHIACSAADPLVNPDFHDRFDRIHRYARESENSMYKAMRELGKLQSETQFRSEICPLTTAQAADPEFVAKTPHALSQVCFMTQIYKHVLSVRKHTPRPDSLESRDALEVEARFEANSGERTSATAN